MVLALVLGVIFAVLRSVPVRPRGPSGRPTWSSSATPSRCRPSSTSGWARSALRPPPWPPSWPWGSTPGPSWPRPSGPGSWPSTAGCSEASRSLGLSYGQTMRYVVLPQAIATTVPPPGNLAIALTKNTSLASSIAVADLLYVANLVNSRTFATYEVFGFVAQLPRRDPPHGRRCGAPGAPPDPLPLAHVLGEGKATECVGATENEHGSLDQRPASLLRPPQVGRLPGAGHLGLPLHRAPDHPGHGRHRRLEQPHRRPLLALCRISRFPLLRYPAPSSWK